MNETVRDITGIFALIVGVAFVTVLVRSGSQTPTIIQNTFSGFASALTAAMGGTSTQSFGVTG